MPPDPEPLRRLDLYEVLHSLSEGVTLADANGHIVFQNRAADRILGVEAATEESPEGWTEHYGVFLSDGHTPFPTDRYPLVRALAGEVTTDVEMLIRNEGVRGGSLISVSGQPIRGDDGTIVGGAVVFRDVTRLRNTQRELERVIAELVETQRLKDDLSAFLVHDLKNPLTAILTTCELLAEGGLEDDHVREDVDTIRGAADRLHRMVMNLLDLQVAEDGRLELDRNVASVADMLEEVLVVSAPRVRQRRQSVEIGAPAGLTVWADRSLLSRMLLNLVDNCVKYGPEGGTIWIEARAAESGNTVIEVRDEGPGVPPELRELIFEKYAQVERDEGRRASDSRGLGLRFCKVAVEAHGGRIWVEDAEPDGARFCIALAAGAPDG